MSKVFIGWSGKGSHEIATSLEILLRRVVPTTKPWVSDKIAPGSDWEPTIQDAADGAVYGIVCLSPESIDSPYVHYELGMMRMGSLGKCCVPFLVGVSFDDLKPPFTKLQSIDGEKRDSVFRLCKDLDVITRRAADPKDDDEAERLEDLKIRFNQHWQEFANIVYSVKTELEENYIEFSTRRKAELDLASRRIAHHLAINASWLVKPLKRAGVFEGGSVVLRDRMQHYSHEKTFLAKKFTTNLFERINRNRNKKHLIIIDSGSTMVSMFEQIKEYVGKNPQYRDSVDIVTNNLAGIQNFIDEKSNDNLGNNHGNILNCFLVGGIPFEAYNAIVGQRAAHSLNEIVNDYRKAHNNLTIVALVTGNWNWIPDDKSMCPMPLVSGFGHLVFKQMAMHLADESYLLSPLGKTFIGNTFDNIKKTLIHTNNPFKKYETVDINMPKGEINTRNISLVTTKRTKGEALLHDHGNRLLDVLGLDPKNHSENMSRLFREGAPLCEVGPLIFGFDLPDEEIDELEIEFPHAYSRKVEFQRLFTGRGITD